jgi:hypothetical protein
LNLPFHTATFATASAPMRPTHWLVDVYPGDHIVEERQATAWNDAGRSAHLKAMLCKSQGKEHTPKTNTNKSHQPRLLTGKQYITSITDNDLLLIEPTFPELELVSPPTVL